LFGLTQVESKARNLLKSFKVDGDIVKEVLEQTASMQTRTRQDLTPRVREMLAIASNVARKTGSSVIAPEHLLIALLSQEDSFAVNILAGVLKLNVYDLRNRAIMLLNKPNQAQTSTYEREGLVEVGNLSGTSSKAENEPIASSLPSELLDMGSDLTMRAKKGKIDPVIGRDEEIERMIEILCRKTKNNPVLIGEAGVGKTAIVEGLARRIVSGDVPNFLKNKIVYSMDIGGLMAGTKYRGSMGEKL